MFHDPVLADRRFLNRPGQALRSFLLAATAGFLAGALLALRSLAAAAHGQGA